MTEYETQQLLFKDQFYLSTESPSDVFNVLQKAKKWLLVGWVEEWGLQNNF